MVKKVGIIGAGITGLTVANMLKRSSNFDVHVFERAPIISPTLGAGFALQSGAHVLRKFGFKNKIEEIGHPIFTCRNYRMDGQRFTEVELMRRTYHESEDEPLLITMTRAGFLNALAEPLIEQGGMLHLGKELIKLEENNHKVQAFFKGGDVEEFDILLGCDGVWSKVRTQFLEAQQSSYSGFAVWYGLTKKDKNFADKIKNVTIRQSGIGRTSVIYPAGNEGQILLAIVEATSEVHEENWEIAGLQHKLHEMVLANQFTSIFPECVERVERLMHFGINTRPTPTAAWYSPGSRVCLLGDAAHATLPFGGHGVNHAIEDALCLTHLMIKNPEYPEVVFKEYCEKRAPRVIRLIERAHFLSKVEFQKNPFFCKAKDAAMSILYRHGKGVLRKEMETNWKEMRKSTKEFLD